MLNTIKLKINLKNSGLGYKSYVLRWYTIEPRSSGPFYVLFFPPFLGSEFVQRNCLNLVLILVLEDLLIPPTATAEFD